MSQNPRKLRESKGHREEHPQIIHELATRFFSACNQSGRPSGRLCNFAVQMSLCRPEAALYVVSSSPRLSNRSSSLLSLFLDHQTAMLRTASAFSLSTSQGKGFNPFSSSSYCFTSSSALQFPRRNLGGGFAVFASNEGSYRPVTGFVFEPFEEVKKELLLVPTAPQESLARHKYSDESEAAINEQINVEYNVSYVYHAMYAYFDRDNVALKGLAEFFKESSEEEREHAEKLMEYQNKRGGKVKLQSILLPLSEFDHAEKGDALYAMELALSLEKLTSEKLLNLRSVADRSNDVQLIDFIDSEFLAEQVEAIKKISEYVSQLRRVGKGHGVWHFDQMLLHDEIVA